MWSEWRRKRIIEIESMYRSSSSCWRSNCNLVMAIFFVLDERRGGTKEEDDADFTDLVGEGDMEGRGGC